MNPTTPSGASGPSANQPRLRVVRPAKDGALFAPMFAASGHLRSRGANSWRNATLETEICGQRLWERHAEKGRLNVPNRPQRPVLRAQATEMSGYF